MRFFVKEILFGFLISGKLKTWKSHFKVEISAAKYISFFFRISLVELWRLTSSWQNIHQIRRTVQPELQRFQSSDSFMISILLVLMQSVSSCKIDDCFKIRTPTDFIKCPIWNEFITYELMNHKFWVELTMTMMSSNFYTIWNPLDRRSEKSRILWFIIYELCEACFI